MTVRHLERALQLLAIAAIVASLAALGRPFTKDDFPGGHDATAHITYTFLFDRALSQGQWPVRWVEWVRPGESQPLFNFYPPGLYGFVELAHHAGLRLSTAFKLTIPLLWWMGAALTFAWLRPLGRWPAALGAAVFALAPYALVDLFVRAAYPEVAALALAPGLLWSIDRVTRSGRVADAARVALFTAALLLCHLLSSLIFAPVMAAYAAVRAFRGPTPARRLGLAAAGALGGAGLAAFYVLPSLLEMGGITIGRMTSGDAAYESHFVAPAQWFSSAWGFGASVPGPADGMPLQIGVVQCAVIALGALVLAAPGLHRRLPDAAALAFWLAAIAAALFLMTDASAPLWRAIPALAYLQFPWRYFVVVTVGAAALSALLLAAVPSRTVQVLLLLAVVGWQHHVHRHHLHPQLYIPWQTMNIDQPRWAEARDSMPFIERGFTPIAAVAEPPADVSRWSLVEGRGEVDPVYVADHHLVLDVSTAAGARLRLATRAFPGWTIAVDGGPAAMAVDPRYGFMAVDVPAGRHRVEARFANTPVRSAANAISVASALLCAAGLAWGARLRRRAATPPD